MSVVLGLPGIGDHPHGPVLAEPRLACHRQAGVGGPQAPPAGAEGRPWPIPRRWAPSVPRWPNLPTLSEVVPSGTSAARSTA